MLSFCENNIIMTHCASPTTVPSGCEISGIAFHECLISAGLPDESHLGIERACTQRLCRSHLKCNFTSVLEIMCLFFFFFLLTFCFKEIKKKRSSASFGTPYLIFYSVTHWEWRGLQTFLLSCDAQSHCQAFRTVFSRNHLVNRRGHCEQMPGLSPGRLKLDIRKNLFSERLVKYWKRLPETWLSCCPWRFSRNV